MTKITSWLKKRYFSYNLKSVEVRAEIDRKYILLLKITKMTFLPEC